MTDWKKHIEAHFSDLHFRLVETGVVYGDEKEPKKNSEKDFEEFKARIMKFLIEKKSDSYSCDEYEADEIIESIKLCESFDEFRRLSFNDTDLNKDTVINIPLTIRDIEIIYLAMNEEVDKKLMEANYDLMKAEDAKSKKLADEIGKRNGE